MKTNIWKRLLSLALTLVLVVSCLPGTVLPALAAETSGTCGDNITWEYGSTTKTLTITGTGAMYDYAALRTPWVDYSQSVEKIVISDGITHISDYCCYSFSDLTDVTIPSSVVSIGKYAFEACDKLETITLPDNLTTIGERAFYECTKLTSIEIPAKVTSIGDGAFGACKRLPEITVNSANTSFISVDGVLFNQPQFPLRENK